MLIEQASGEQLCQVRGGAGDRGAALSDVSGEQVITDHWVSQVSYEAMHNYMHNYKK